MGIEECYPTVQGRMSDDRNEKDIPEPLTLIDIITSNDPAIRNVSLSDYCNSKDKKLSKDKLLVECEHLDEFRRKCTNLYERVRACFFLYAIHRFHLLDNEDCDAVPSFSTAGGDVVVPYQAILGLKNRQFAEAIDVALPVFRTAYSQPVSSLLAKAYHALALQSLATQVQTSVREYGPNAWMFDRNTVGSCYAGCRLAAENGCHQNGNTHSPPQPCIHHPYPVISKLRSGQTVLHESTPVRLDFTHAGWSDIFFLAMDYPQGAKVVNLSIDLSVWDPDTSAARDNIDVVDSQQKPPIDCYLQVIDRPVLKLTSIDLKADVELTNFAEVFDFGKDYLGLLRAGIVASGIVPPALEPTGDDRGDGPLSILFESLLGSTSKGLHLTTHVHNIPKGSRLAVSTNLLASIIALGMRATGQIELKDGNCIGGPSGDWMLTEPQRRVVAARAILGEWLGGSGGGWQDSGGVWPGLKLIQGMPPSPDDVEFGISRGQLLPNHTPIPISEKLRQALLAHVVLVHGGMAMNVGPILELVTEKYLLRDASEWKARGKALELFDGIVDALHNVDMPRLAQLTTENFSGPLQAIIPGATNAFTECVIDRTRSAFNDDFLGFAMLGGASGGGMGFIFTPEVKARAMVQLRRILLDTKCELEQSMPFAMDPVVYDFSINDRGTVAKWDTEVPTLYTGLSCENELKKDHKQAEAECSGSTALDKLLHFLGFDDVEHELLRREYRSGKIGLMQNRLPIATRLENVAANDVIRTDEISSDVRQLGIEALQNGEVGVLTLAAGVGSRWSGGAGCVKALCPFLKLKGRHRSFLDVHEAKCRLTSKRHGMALVHVVTTSHMTDVAIKKDLHQKNKSRSSLLFVSRGKSIGLRLVPTCRDLRFSWNMQARLDSQAQKVLESGQDALETWAKACGEGSGYRDNIPLQCLHPVGHFYEVPNLFLNGTLQKMLQQRPQLRWLMLHNVDTIGANVEPALLGLFIRNKSTLSFEVMPRRIEDSGGGLARVNGKVQLVEGLALPREEDEFKLAYYNSMTTWIDVDKLLTAFKLDRDDLGDKKKVADAVHSFSHKLPTYVALKECKKRWGNGQEDVFPTAQFEKLWSDVSALDEVNSSFFLVSRNRGCQLKDVSQLSGWLRDGSTSHLDSICDWG